MVRELAGLKARLFWNGLRADRQRQVGLPLILALIVWLGWTFATRHHATLGGVGSGVTPEYLAWAAVVVFVAWIALPVVIFPIDENLDPQQLATLPISRPHLVTGLTAAAFLSPPVLMILALVTVTLAHDPASLLVTVPAALVFLTMLVVASQGFTTMVSAVLHSRRGRDLAIFLVMGIGLASFAGYQTIRTTVEQLGISGASLAHPINHLWWLVPPVAPAHAITSAWSGDWLGVALGLTAAVAWTLVIVVAWERMLRWLLVTPKQEKSGSSARRASIGMARGGWSVPLMVARKELRFYLRDPRQRLVWTGTVIFVGLAIAAIVVGSEGFTRFRTREWLPALAPIMVLMVGMPIALNQFGWERNAASYLFALPAKPRSLIIGKNLAAMLGLLVEATFLGILLSWFSSWRWTGLVVPLALGSILCLLAVGNIVSVLTPLRLPREGTDMFAQATEQGLLALVSQFISFAFIGVLLALPASVTVLTVAFGEPIAPWFTVLFSIGWGLLWYGLSLLVAGWLLRRRVPEVVNWVQVS